MMANAEYNRVSAEQLMYRPMAVQASSVVVSQTSRKL